MLVVLASSDKVSLYNNHFGDADFYLVYDVTDTSIKLIDTLINTEKTIDHDHGPEHGNKAKRILNLFNEYDVKLLVNQAFGSNIKKIKEFITPAVSRIKDVEMVLKTIQVNLNQVEQLIQEEQILILQNDLSITIL